MANDPAQFPRRYRNRNDREIAAFLAATIAWGRRDLILKSAERMFALMGPSPYAFAVEGAFGDPEDSGPETRKNGSVRSSRGFCVHRTFFEEDLRYFCRGFRACYARYGSLEALFAEAPDLWEGISRFREILARASGGVYSKHVANPQAGSACKRLCLALRWLVRREGPVDMGLWKSVSPASLFIPLDLHVGRAARHLGLIEGSRRANDKKAVLSITEKLRELCPEDPVKYDLALFAYSALPPEAPFSAAASPEAAARKGRGD